MKCEAIEEFKEIEEKIDRLTVRLWLTIIILIAVSAISNLIWLCVFIDSQREFEYTVVETTETVITQDDEGVNLAVVGSNNNIGGSINGANSSKNQKSCS